jgi:hypothetical protein
MMPLVIVATGPYFVAAMASSSLKAGFARQRTVSGAQPV